MEDELNILMKTIDHLKQAQKEGTKPRKYTC